MKGKIIWLATGFLVTLALILASCSPPVATPKAPAAPTSPSAPSAPVTTRPTAPLTPAPITQVTSGEPQYGGQIAFTEALFMNLDPVRYHQPSNHAQSFVFEKLVIGDWALDRKVYNFAGQTGRVPEKYLKGALLESWEAPDPLTVILHVRKGVRFHNKPPVNGRELNADDIQWNIERTRLSPFSDRAYLDYIQSSKVIDKWTVEMKLVPPPRVDIVATILDTMNLYFIPKEVIGKSGEIEDWKLLIGTGPYMIEDYVPASAMTFRRNPDYWAYDELHPKNRLPYTDTAKDLIIPDYMVQLTAMRTGQIDWKDSIEWRDADNIKKSKPEIGTRMLPFTNPFVYRMRTDTNKYFKDVRVRQAMSMSINRQEMVDTIFGGYAALYQGYVDPSHGELYTPYDKLPDKPMWTTVSVKEVVSYNPEKAKKLLAEAGVPNGFKTHINMTTVRDRVGLTEAVQAYLAKIGVQAEIKAMESGAFDTLRYGRAHTDMILAWATSYPNPLHYISYYTPGHQWNISMVDDPVYTAMIDKAWTTFDYTARAKMIYECNMYSLEHAWHIDLPHNQIAIMWQPWVKGYQGEGWLSAHNTASLLSRLWIDTATKNRMLGKK